MNKKILILLLSGLFLLPELLTGQDNSSVIRGMVTDETSNPLAGAAVSIENTFLGTLTDRDGTYDLYRIKGWLI